MSHHAKQTGAVFKSVGFTHPALTTATDPKLPPVKPDLPVHPDRPAAPDVPQTPLDPPVQDPVPGRPAPEIPDLPDVGDPIDLPPGPQASAVRSAGFERAD